MYRLLPCYMWFQIRSSLSLMFLFIILTSIYWTNNLWVSIVVFNQSCLSILSVKPKYFKFQMGSRTKLMFEVAIKPGSLVWKMTVFVQQLSLNRRLKYYLFIFLALNGSSMVIRSCSQLPNLSAKQLCWMPFGRPLLIDLNWVTSSPASGSHSSSSKKLTISASSLLESIHCV